MKIGRKIFFDNVNGNIILDKGEMQGGVVEETIDEIIPKFTALSERNRETFDVLELPYGAYANDFREGTLIGVDLVARIPIFSYPDPNAPAEPIVELVPLSTQVKQLQYSQKTSDERYNELDKVGTPLSDLKNAKMSQLDEACNMAITSGFTSTVGTTEYLFSCSLSAQANFQGTDALFKDALITEAQWTVVNVSTGAIERVVLNQTDFNSVKLQVFQHINANISKFRNTLQPQVESATTNAEVDAIVW